MDMHLAITQHAVRSLDGLTAFSALPNAPVQPVRHRRRRGFAAMRPASWRVRGAPARIGGVAVPGRA